MVAEKIIFRLLCPMTQLSYSKWIFQEQISLKAPKMAEISIAFYGWWEVEFKKCLCLIGSHPEGKLFIIKISGRESDPRSLIPIHEYCGNAKGDILECLLAKVLFLPFWVLCWNKPALASLKIARWKQFLFLLQQYLCQPIALGKTLW